MINQKNYILSIDNISNNSNLSSHSQKLNKKNHMSKNGLLDNNGINTENTESINKKEKANIVLSDLVFDKQIDNELKIQDTKKIIITFENNEFIFTNNKKSILGKFNMRSFLKYIIDSSNININPLLNEKLFSNISPQYYNISKFFINTFILTIDNNINLIDNSIFLNDIQLLIKFNKLLDTLKKNILSIINNSRLTEFFDQIHITFLNHTLSLLYIISNDIAESNNNILKKTIILYTTNIAHKLISYSTQKLNTIEHIQELLYEQQKKSNDYKININNKLNNLEKLINLQNQQYKQQPVFFKGGNKKECSSYSKSSNSIESSESISSESFSSESISSESISSESISTNSNKTNLNSILISDPLLTTYS
jgi:hypothetical protein